jgi:hypothetical protein
MDGMAQMITKGDANGGTETWSVRADGQVGRVVLRVPKAGYALTALRTPGGPLAFVVAPAALLGLGLLWRIWRPGTAGRTADAAA